MNRIASFRPSHRLAMLALVLLFWAAGSALQQHAHGSTATVFQHLCYLGGGLYAALVSLVMANPTEGDVSVSRTFLVLGSLLTMGAPVFAAVGHFVQPTFVG